MRSLPNSLPSVKFPNFGNVSRFSIFFCFSYKKKEENLEKTLLDKSGPNRDARYGVTRKVRRA